MGLTMLLTALLLGTISATAETHKSLSKKMGSSANAQQAGTSNTGATIASLRRKTLYLRAEASYDASLIHARILWAPLSDTQSGLRVQYAKAKAGLSFWRARYRTVTKLRKEIHRARAATSLYAGKLGHRFVWTPRSYVPSELKKQYAAAASGERYWLHRYVMFLRTQTVLTNHQAYLVTCSFPWPCNDAWTVFGLESGHNRLATNGQYHGYGQLSASIRARYGIGEGYAAGPNITASYENWADPAMGNHHFCPQWSTACSAGIP